MTACNVNGRPVIQTVELAPLNHYSIADTTSTTGGVVEPIDIDQAFTEHVRMEQLIGHWSAIPTTLEYLELWKISGSNAKLNTLLRRFDPSVGGENVQDFSCVIPFYWLPTDSVVISYPNTDDLNIGVEIMLVEVR